MMDGDFLEVEAEGASALTFVPPSLYAPPEFVGADWKDSGKPALVMKRMGGGTIAWIPRDIGGLYFRYSLKSHRGILANLVDRLLPSGRDIRSNAHPLVKMTLLRQRNRHLLHLTSLAGHSDTAYFEPLPMNSIRIEVRGDFSRIKAVRTGKELAAARSGGFTSCELPLLEEYELLEHDDAVSLTSTAWRSSRNVRSYQVVLSDQGSPTLLQGGCDVFGDLHQGFSGATV